MVVASGGGHLSGWHWACRNQHRRWRAAQTRAPAPHGRHLRLVCRHGEPCWASSASSQVAKDQRDRRIAQPRRRGGQVQGGPQKKEAGKPRMAEQAAAFKAKNNQRWKQ